MSVGETAQRLIIVVDVGDWRTVAMVFAVGLALGVIGARWRR